MQFPQTRKTGKAHGEKEKAKPLQVYEHPGVAGAGADTFPKNALQETTQVTLVTLVTKGQASRPRPSKSGVTRIGPQIKTCLRLAGTPVSSLDLPQQKLPFRLPSGLNS